MDLLVGMKEMLKIANDDMQNIKKEAVSSKKDDIIPNLDNIFLQNDETHNEPGETKSLVKKQKGKPRGVSQKTPDELSQHLARMREKAAIVKREKAEERKKKLAELNDIKLSKKLDIPVETLAEYEDIRKQEVVKKQTEKPQAQQPLDLDIIVNKLFDRINTARQAEEQAKLLKEKQAADALLIKQKIDNENIAKQRLMQQRNNQYFSNLGNGKTPVKANADWMALFNRKK